MCLAAETLAVYMLRTKEMWETLCSYVGMRIIKLQVRRGAAGWGMNGSVPVAGV